MPKHIQRVIIITFVELQLIVLNCSTNNAILLEGEIKVIVQYLKEFYNKLIEQYPNLTLYYEYDAELDLHFLWHTNVEYDNDVTFENATFRLQNSIFEVNGIFNVVFSSMLENHLTQNGIFDANVNISIDNTTTGSFSDVEYQGKNNDIIDDIICTTNASSSTLITESVIRKAYSVQNPVSTCTKCANNIKPAECNLELAA